MNRVNETLYLKIEQSTQVRKPEVTIADVGKIQCSNSTVKARVSQMRLFKFDGSQNAKKKQYQTFSVLKVIQMIQQEYPNVEVQSLGEADFIVHYVAREEKMAVQFLKTAIICFIVFFGAAFMIVTFCKEVSLTLMLDFVYERVTGLAPTSITLLDISFCVGLPIGVITFYNHIGRKKFDDDPTPVQVAMNKYEKDVDSACIETKGREGKTIDVD